MSGPEPSYVSRGGFKLAAALDAFGFDVVGRVCADLGCSVGGFTDCLLQRGAAKVYAVDTAYGQLAWTLRNDPRVSVLERSNALHAEPPEPCSLVVVDLGWTKQERAVPAALRWLAGTPHPSPGLVSLIKPHYETTRGERGQALKAGKRGVLNEDEAEAVLGRVLETLPGLGVTVERWIRSPIEGGKGGNVEYLALLRPAHPAGQSISHA